MELIAKISKGSKMDQIYIPKQRAGFNIGNYVLIKPITLEKEENTKKSRLYFYNTKKIESLKIAIINEIIEITDKNVQSDNIIITGSFLDKGFNFNDIDIIIITDKKNKTEKIKEDIEKNIGIKAHFILISNKELIKGLSSDLLFQVMLSRCVARERFIYKVKKKINYKILDLHLLKSKLLIDNYNVLNGNEKYNLTRNLIAIYLFLMEKKINNDSLNKKIIKLFRVESIDDIKQNMLDKNKFLKNYKKIYNKSFDIILNGIKKDAKQKKTD